MDMAGGIPVLGDLARPIPFASTVFKGQRISHRFIPVGVVGPRSAFLQETEQLLQSGQLSPRVAFDRFYSAKQVDRAMKLFDAKAEPRFIRWLHKIWLPYGRPFRTHPHFASIVASLNLIPYWREFGWPENCKPDPRHGVRCH